MRALRSLSGAFIALASICILHTNSSDAAAPDAGTAEFRLSGDLPDPPPLTSRDQWLIDLRYDKGELYFVEATKKVLEKPRETPRAMGRFAIELWEGKTLLERVRFDFPLLLTESLDGGHTSFDKKLTSRIGVYFPAVSRGTQLELVDRATNRRWPLTWPMRASDGGAR